jgi:hypothetical protein
MRYEARQSALAKLLLSQREPKLAAASDGDGGRALDRLQHAPGLPWRHLPK